MVPPRVTPDQCEDCDTVKIAPGHKLYNIKCQQCGARLIKRIQGMTARPPAERSERCKAVLADWVAWGHGELEIRSLVKKM